MEFSTILKELREKKNYTQEELGAMLNLTKNAISHYENNANQPSLDTIIKLADIFDVSIDYLLGRTPNNISYSKLTQKYIGKIRVTELLENLLSLDTEHRHDLVSALKYIHSHNTIFEKKNL
ncbi:MAG: helix-turn-helix transcriptional regulator [Ruminococcaceae bacterium]|nr:helix-turn-helix transcriptional regulator [Oscillospiraceae bacterium]